MKKLVSCLSLALSIGSIALLSACGGGGDSSPTSGSSNSPAPSPAPAASPEGVYAGSLTGSASNAFQLLVLEDSSYWSIYGTQSGGILYVNGFVQGTGAVAGLTLTSSTGRDFGFAPSLAGTLNATYVAGTSITGTVASTAGNVSFNGTTAAATGYTYSSPAKLSDISGSWLVTLLGGERATLTISSTGAVTGLSQLGCQFTGTATPRPSGKNVFNVTVSFGASPCALAGQTGAGIAVYSSPTATTKQLIVAVVDPTRTYGTAAFGNR